ncbi:MAG: hypothetical protein JSW45_02275, partial [Thiotrichales bacterium]
QAVPGQFMPHCYVFAIPEDDRLPPALAEKTLTDQVQAYVCEGMHCLPPISSRREWHDLIEDCRAIL